MRHLILVSSLLAGLAPAVPAAASESFWRTYADIGAIGIPTAAAVYSYAQDDRNGLYQLVETGFVAGASATALKYIVNSERPNGGNHSFPSGHTSLAFAGGGYMHARYGWRVGLPFEIMAATVGFARVESRDHHWYDVVAGAAIGEGSAFLLTRRLREDVRVSMGGDSHGGIIQVAAQF